ncbi:hypothetical protein [Advenella kashmirensis]|nr:hypothetical protein [Advenella kashmirensis]
MDISDRLLTTGTSIDLALAGLGIAQRDPKVRSFVDQCVRSFTGYDP